jgi:chromosome partitioning protein
MAAILASAGHKTLLIDADPQGNATSSLGYDVLGIEDTLYNFLLGDKKFNEIVIQTKYDNFSLIKSNNDLANINLVLFNNNEREYTLKNALQDHIKEYEYIIIDSPPNLDILTVNIMTWCNYIIIPVKADYLSLHGIITMLETYKNIKYNFNNKLLIIGLVITMFNASTKICQEVENEVREKLNVLVFKTKIPQNVKITESPSFGMPIIYHDPKSTGAIKYIELVKEVLARIHRINQRKG